MILLESLLLMSLLPGSRLIYPEDCINALKLHVLMLIQVCDMK